MFGSYIAIARRIAAGNRWLVVAFAVLIGLWGFEFLAHGAVGVVRDLMTLKATVDKANAEACEAQYRVMTAAGNQSIADLMAPTPQMLVELKKRLREGCNVHFAPVQGSGIGEAPVSSSAPITTVEASSSASPITTITDGIKYLWNWGELGTIGEVVMALIIFIAVIYVGFLVVAGIVTLYLVVVGGAFLGIAMLSKSAWARLAKVWRSRQRAQVGG